jgi:Tol biopolymer transport system component
MNRKLSLLTLTLMLAGSLLSGCSLAGTPAPSPTPSASATQNPPTQTINPSPTPALIEHNSEWIAYLFCSGDHFGGGEDFKTCEIYVMNPDGSHPIQLTHDNVWDCCPAWSPDGTKIAFGSFNLEPWSSQISIMNADGSGLTRLPNDGRFDEHPSWSPDGRHIVFSSGERGVGSAIYVMEADFSNRVRLTGEGRWDTAPAWSPDGTKIAYESVDADNPGDDQEIYVINADGSNPIRLTDNDRGDLAPAWSPDGTKIAFVAYETNGVEEIYVMNADGSHPVRLTDNSASDDTPAWSPDGSSIAFTSDRDGSQEIYVMNADGTSQTRLTYTAGSGIAGGPAWIGRSPDTARQPADCSSGWSRLHVSAYAVVTGGPSDPPNRVRASPSTGAEVVAQIYGGTIVRVLEGPVCANGLVFWKVENASIPGGTGWTAEGDGKDYYLEPYKP